VETHNPEEMKFALELGAKLMGINNRNILELEKDGGTVDTTVEVMKQLRGDIEQSGRILVSESGILTPEDAVSAIESGADAVLIGTAIWKSENPFEFVKRLIGNE
jgi:indole-3-glycerol phosphate synthase